MTILLSAFVYIMLQATHKPTQLTKFLSKGTEFSSQTKSSNPYIFSTEICKPLIFLS